MSLWVSKARCSILLLVIWQLAACAAGARLSNAERAGLAQQKVIHVLHYETALPRIEGRAKTGVPTAASVRRHAAADPAAVVAQSFSRLLAKKEMLKNLRVEPRHLSLPVAKNAVTYREKFRHGLVLELWTNTWTFAALPADTKTYAMILGLSGRLTRLEDGHVLWSTGHCNMDGNNNRELRLLGTELTSGTRLRKLLAAAREECARQLVRDFGVRSP